MKVADIQKKSAKLRATIKKTQAELDKLQQICKHRNKSMVDAKYGASTGGHDGPAFDLYWVDVHCRACGAHMCFYSNHDREKYRFYGDFVKRK